MKTARNILFGLSLPFWIYGGFSYENWPLFVGTALLLIALILEEISNGRTKNNSAA